MNEMDNCDVQMLSDIFDIWIKRIQQVSKLKSENPYDNYRNESCIEKYPEFKMNYVWDFAKPEGISEGNPERFKTGLFNTLDAIIVDLKGIKRNIFLGCISRAFADHIDQYMKIYPILQKVQRINSVPVKNAGKVWSTVLDITSKDFDFTHRMIEVDNNGCVKQPYHVYFKREKYIVNMNMFNYISNIKTEKFAVTICSESILSMYLFTSMLQKFENI
jgi:hypothetical protein